MGLQEDIADRIDALDLSLYRVAKDTETAYKVIHNLYHGRTDARLVTLDKVVDYLGLRLQPITRQQKKRSK